MYRRPKFLEELLEIREQMSRDAFYDADLFAEQVRSGRFGAKKVKEETAETAKKHDFPAKPKKRVK